MCAQTPDSASCCAVLCCRVACHVQGECRPSVVVPSLAAFHELLQQTVRLAAPLGGAAAGGSEAAGGAAAAAATVGQ
jgi:hypothetical protein